MQEYLECLLKDKARLRKWKKVVLALSCIVVVCTVYALSLPAQTLACNIEEHAHTAECYDENNELICTKEEHTHSEDCYEKEEQEQEQDPVEEENEESPVVEDEPETQNDDEQVSQVSEEETTTTTTETTTEPYNLNSDANEGKIKDIKLTYTKGDVKHEVKPKESVDTPDNLSMEFHLTYNHIKVSELNSYGNKITYQLPEQFAVGEEIQKDLLDGNQKFGVLNVSKTGLMTITYYQDYLDKVTGEDAEVNATFFASVQVKLSELVNGTTIIKTPKGDITLNFGTDYIQRYGNVELAKSHTEVGSSDYIDYTIEVRAGAEGCKDLVVVDKFTQNEYLVTYEGITKTEQELNNTKNNYNPYEDRDSDATAGKIYLANALADNSEQKIPDKIDGNTTLTEPGSFVWTIGDMKPNEIRKLHYCVKLSDAPGVIETRNNQNVNNKAIVYARGNGNNIFNKAEATDLFETKLIKSMNKTVLSNEDGKSYIRDTDGNYTINYKLEFTSTTDSNYPLKDFGFWDYLSKTDGDITTNGYVTYVKDSIKLFEKKNKQSDYTEIDKNNFNVTWASKNSSEYSDVWNEERLSFYLKGKNGHPITVNPGDSYYVTYIVKVKPEVFAKMQLNSVLIKNSFSVNSSNATQKDGANQGFIASSEINTVNLDDYNWVHKTKTEDITSDTPITMSGKRYNEKFEEDTATSTFKVPKGSYKYQVIVNKTHGLWDVTKATLEDSFSPSEMVYVGYAKITPHDEKNNTDITPVWVKIDGKSSFSINLNQIGFKKNTYSYTIEYYATPKKLSMVSQVTVTNTFALNGTVQKGNDTFTSTFDRVNSSSSVTLVGDYNIETSKYSWYYEKPKEDATYWRNGKLYWVIEVNGSGIKKDTKITDCISSDSNLEDHFLHSDPHGNDSSIVGVYLDNENPSTHYKNFEEYSKTHTKENIDDYFDIEYKKGKFENIPSVASQDYGKLILTAKKNIDLNQKNMYIVIQTKPCNLPREYRKPLTYRNELWKKDTGEEDTKIGTADKKLYYGGDILKELGQVFTYDGTNVVTNRTTGGQDLKGKDPESKICKKLLAGSGDYVSWAFKLNYSGELNGSYRVLEKIPEGMNLAYVRVKWRGSQAYQNVNSQEISGLDTTWQRRENTCDGDGDLNKNIKTIYYVKDKQVLIQLGDFNEQKVEDNESVDVQVVCKVTDPEALLGNGKEFVNSVTLQTENGKKDIDTASSAVTVKSSSLSKSGTSIPKDSKIDYEIIANPLGQTLSSDNSTNLTLIDELGENLILDSTSIHAIRTDTNTEIEISWKIDGNKIEFEIPDNTPVKITYTTLVNVQPNTPITVKNDVYWKSYKVSKIEKTIDFTYTVDAGGSGSVSNNPELKLYKFDKDVSKPLSGVKLQVSECQLQDGQITTTNNSTEVTSTDSVLTLQSSQFTMNYNQIYEVKEIETVDGYNLDQSPYYIMYAKASSDNSYPDIVNQFNEYKNKQSNKDRFKIVYTSAAFKLEIPNEQKGITVKKAFINNAAGNDTNPVSGIYNFGLYVDENNLTSPLQTVSITYKANETQEKTAKFINLELGKTYYVFELDSKGQPIKDSQEATVNTMKYQVVYKNETTKIADNTAKNGDTVTVTNKSSTKILPSTGSMGTLIYRMSGTALVVAGTIGLSEINKKRKKENRRRK